MSAVYIPEDNVRNDVSSFSEFLFHFVIERPVLIATIINFHIRDNDYSFWHCCWRNIILLGNIKYFLKCSFEVCAIAPICFCNIDYFLMKCFSLQRNNLWTTRECHKQIMICSCISLSKIYCQAD